MAQITLISIYLPLILSLMPFPLIVPKKFFVLGKNGKKFTLQIFVFSASVFRRLNPRLKASLPRLYPPEEGSDFRV